MSATRTARRRRKQAKMGYTHLAKRKRPRYNKSAGGGQVTAPGAKGKKKSK